MELVTRLGFSSNADYVIFNDESGVGKHRHAVENRNAAKKSWYLKISLHQIK